MSHNNIKLGFILFILIMAILIILDQCGCCGCSCEFNCKKNNRVNIEPQPSLPTIVRARPLRVIDNEVVVTGEHACAQEVVRDNAVLVDAYVINVIE
tara:strand:+ start:3406 stop:3696 length:291 start_codon:yes stop_codon:yes gene_type:complete